MDATLPDFAAKDGADDGRLWQMLLGILDKIVRAAEGRHHALEAFGGLAVLKVFSNWARAVLAVAIFASTRSSAPSASVTSCRRGIADGRRSDNPRRS